MNPNCPEVDDVEVFAAFSDLPGPVDVVISAVPAAHVVAVARAAAARAAAAIDAAAMIVFAGGFAEAGDAGALIQDELGAVADNGRLRILGPNSGGVIVASSATAMSFLTCLDRPAEEIRSGAVGLVTQSGGTGSYLHNLAAAQGGGLAASISTGNELDIDVADGIKMLTGLDEVRAIGVVLETVRNGPAFVEAVRGAHAVGKRVVVARMGTSEHGGALMRTHTGAMARPSRVIEGVLASLGVPVAETPQEMLGIAEILALSQRPSGARVGIVTHSGGVGILLSDLAASTAIDLPSPSAQLRGALRPLLEQGSLDNPLDMGGIIGGAHRFGEVGGAFARSGDVDAVLAVSSPHPRAHTAARVESLLALSSAVPIVHLWMAGDVGAHGLATLRHSGVPVTEEPRVAIRAMTALVDHGSDRRVPADPSGLGPTRLPASPMSEHSAKQVLGSWGFRIVPGEVAKTAQQAADAADRIGFPVVLKVSSPDITHKTEVGGVSIGLTDRRSVATAVDELTAAARIAAPAAMIDGVLVERCEPGAEVIVGAVRDETFGPMVLVGIGGMVAEAFDDARVALAPLTPLHASDMIDSLAGVALLKRPRRGSAADLASLASLVALLGDRIVADPSIDAVDMNPIAWTGSEWLVLDASVMTSA